MQTSTYYALLLCYSFVVFVFRCNTYRQRIYFCILLLTGLSMYVDCVCERTNFKKRINYSLYCVQLKYIRQLSYPV